MNSFLTPFRESIILKALFAVAFFFYSLMTAAQVDEIPVYKSINIDLYNDIIKMDSIYFTAYNSCDLKTQSSIYADDIEFFHDKGGLLTDKNVLLKSLEENICNKVTRTLIEGSVEVHPIKGYGAIQIGYHKFLNKLAPDAESIPSKFIVVWKKEKENWKITKVISLH
jgi:ketosteroid isomerase-like protein